MSDSEKAPGVVRGREGRKGRPLGKMSWEVKMVQGRHKIHINGSEPLACALADGSNSTKRLGEEARRWLSRALLRRCFALPAVSLGICELY